MFRQFLANWLLTTTEQTVAKGVAGVLELHLSQYNIRSKSRAKEMKVPQFIYDEYIAESNQLGMKQTRSFAGVQIGVSTNDRFEFI